MRILIISQYFYPESFRINELAKYLSEKDQNITIDVLTGYPNYPSGKISKEFKENKLKFIKFNKVNIYRVPIIPRGSASIFKLFLNYISFLVSVIFLGYFKIRKKKYDYILTFGTTPITVALASIFFSKIKNCKNILWVLDLWPQILLDLKILKHNSFFYSKLLIIINWIYKKHNIILAQSKSFIKEISLVNNNTIYFPSWPEDIKSFEEKDGNLEEIFKRYKNNYKIVFAGNIGQAQSIGSLLPTIKSVQDKNITFLFVGGGRKLNLIKKIFEENNIKNVEFLGHYPIEKMNFVFNQADAFLISLGEGANLNKTIPGKFSTYLQYGKPIIGLIEGEVKNYIDKKNLGCVLDYHDNEKNLEKLLTLKLISKVKLKEIEKNCNFLLSSEFNKETILQNFFEKIYSNYKKNLIELNFVNSIDNIPYKNNFVLSGLNLAFLGYLGKKTIKIYETLYCWPDGLFRKFLLEKKTKKIPGRKLITTCNIPNYIEKIIVAGNCSIESKNELKKIYNNKDIKFIDLPYGSPNEIANKVPNLDEKTVLVLTIPTPKQEQVAELITKREKFFKIFCLGGALEMAFGKERVPLFFDRDGFESIYRLRFEPYRRIRRFIVTLIYFFIGIFRGRYRKIHIKYI